jgi:ubiquinone/menaquinone biosynthesis C-methylase UbiE
MPTHDSQSRGAQPANAQSNAYIMPIDTSEMARLIEQDRLVTRAMNGLFPPGLETASLHDVLDVACGPGGWALEVAFLLRDQETEVVGVDISAPMLEHARIYARAQYLENATFEQVDATKTLPFDDASFDVVNARFIIAFLLKENWPTIVQEFGRLTRPGGSIILTEGDICSETNSQALARIFEITCQAMSMRGMYEGVNRSGIMQLLPTFLEASGCERSSIRTVEHVLDYSGGQPAQYAMAKHFEITMEIGRPFLVRSGLVSDEEYTRLRQQAVMDMFADDFIGRWNFTTMWGTKAV